MILIKSKTYFIFLSFVPWKVPKTLTHIAWTLKAFFNIGNLSVGSAENELKSSVDNSPKHCKVIMHS